MKWITVILAMLCGVACAQNEELPAGLVGRWCVAGMTGSGGGTVFDVSGKNNNAIGTGVSLASTGTDKGAVDVSAGGVVKLVGAYRKEYLPPSNITVCAWVFFRASRAYSIIASCHQSATWAFGWTLATTTSARFDFHINSYLIGPVSATVPINKWYFVVGQYNGEKISIFVNMVETSVAYTAYMGTHVDSKLRIGQNTLGDVPADCLTHDVQIYNRTLTKTELNYLYAKGLPEHK